MDDVIEEERMGLCVETSSTLILLQNIWRADEAHVAIMYGTGYGENICFRMVKYAVGNCIGKGSKIVLLTLIEKYSQMANIIVSANLSRSFHFSDTHMNA